MNLLLTLIALSQPQLPIVTAASEPVYTESVKVEWQSADARVVSWELWYGLPTDARRVECGSQKSATVTLLTKGVWWFGVLGLDADGVVVSKVESVTLANIPSIPIFDICLSVDGHEQILVSFTNTPPGQSGMIYWKQNRRIYTP